MRDVKWRDAMLVSGLLAAAIAMTTPWVLMLIKDRAAKELPHEVKLAQAKSRLQQLQSKANLLRREIANVDARTHEAEERQKKIEKERDRLKRKIENLRNRLKACDGQPLRFGTTTCSPAEVKEEIERMYGKYVECRTEVELIAKQVAEWKAVRRQVRQKYCDIREVVIRLETTLPYVSSLNAVLSVLEDVLADDGNLAKATQAARGLTVQVETRRRTTLGAIPLIENEILDKLAADPDFAPPNNRP